MKRHLSLLLTFCTLALATAKLEARTTYINNILENPQDPFFKIIKSNNKDQVKEALKSGLDINQADSSGRTPLMAAASGGLCGLIDLFLQEGANIHKIDYSGDNALMYTLYGHQEKVDALKILIKNGAKINNLNDSEYSPLILATLNNFTNSIDILLEAGASLEQKGKFGGTAFIHACDNSCYEAASLLAQKGANIEAIDSTGFNPLTLAAFNNDGRMIRLLVELGADIGFKTTKRIPVSIKKSFTDFFPQTVYIPVGSTALDIAKQFEKQIAINVLSSL